MSSPRRGVVEHCHFIDSHDQAEAFNARLRAHVVRSLAQGGNIISPSSAAAPPALSWQPSSAAWLIWLPAMARRHSSAAARDPAGKRSAHSHCIPRGDFHLRPHPNCACWAWMCAQELRLSLPMPTGTNSTVANRPGRAEGLGGGHPRFRQLHRQWVATERRRPSDGRPESAGQGRAVHLRGGRLRQSDPRRARNDRYRLRRRWRTSRRSTSIRHLPGLLHQGRSVPPFHFRDFGALVSLSDYNAYGRLGRIGFFKGGFIKGRFAQLSHALLYRSHQLSLHGPVRALMWMADSINARVRPSIRIS